MTEKSNLGSRDRYREFRFEDSLRKYQPPPRKYFKLNESLHKYQFRKLQDSQRQNRLIRLCQTRKMYIASSRQRASQFSRRKEALHQYSVNGSGSVSDFNENISHGGLQNKLSGMQILDQQLEIQRIRYSRSKRYEEEEQNMEINWGLQIKETPIRESLRQKIQRISSEERVKIQEQIKEQEQKNKVKDIQFHIGLVQSLHQKLLKEYNKLQQQENQQLLKESQQYQKYNQAKQSEFRQPFLSETPRKQQIHNHREAKQKITSSIFQHSIQDKGFEQVKVPLPQSSLFQNGKKINEHIIENKSGRVQLKSKTGFYYLSSRILQNLAKSCATPESLGDSLMKHYPYITNVEQIVNYLLEKHDKI